MSFDYPAKVKDETGAQDLPGLLRLNRDEDPARYEMLKYVMPVWERAGSQWRETVGRSGDDNRTRANETRCGSNSSNRARGGALGGTWVDPATGMTSVVTKHEWGSHSGHGVHNIAMDIAVEGATN